MSTRGVVISVHALGATVRLDDGSLAAVPSAEVAKHRGTLLGSLTRREPLLFTVDRQGRHAVARIPSEAAETTERSEPPRLRDESFESLMNAYLKSLEEREPPNRPAPAERHFIRKKRRAAFFEARSRTS